MAARKIAKVAREKKLFTVSQANAALPLVKAIVSDIVELAHALRDRHDRLDRVQSAEQRVQPSAYREEIQQAAEEVEKGQDRLQDYVEELNKLGVELKDFYSGLVDFPSWHENRVIYLCWRHEEPVVEHWHELDSGFTGRQRITARMTKD